MCLWRPEDSHGCQSLVIIHGFEIRSHSGLEVIIHGFEIGSHSDLDVIIHGFEISSHSDLDVIIHGFEIGSHSDLELTKKAWLAAPAKPRDPPVSVSQVLGL